MRHVPGEIVGPRMDNEDGHSPTEDVTLSTMTSTDVLRHFWAPKVMEFLSLDVERAKEDVMSNFD